MNSVILTSSSGDARAEAKSAILLWQHQHDGIQSKSNHIKNQLQHCPQMTSFNSILYFLKQAELNIPTKTSKNAELKMLTAGGAHPAGEPALQFSETGTPKLSYGHIQV